MPTGTERGSAVLGVYGDLIYVVGGMTVLNLDGQDAITTVIAFNTTSEEWQRVPPLAANIPEGRQHAAGAVAGHTMYIIGGRWFGQDDVRDEVFSLDLRNVSSGWTTSRGHMPTARGGIHGGVVGNRFYAFGGEGNANATTGIFPQAEAYDIAGEEWTRLPNMAVPRHGTSAVAVGDRIYIPGGGLQQDGVPIERNGVVSFGHMTGHLDAFEVGSGYGY